MSEEQAEAKALEIDAKLLAHTLAIRALLSRAFGDQRPLFANTVTDGIRAVVDEEGITGRGREVLLASLNYVNDLFEVQAQQPPSADT